MKNTFHSFILLLAFCLPAFVFGQNYQAELNKVNAFLKTFDNGYYGYLEVKDGYLYDRFKSGDHTKSAIDKLDKAKMVETNRKVQLFCKDNNSCVFSTYTNSYHSTMSFSQSTDFNTSTLVDLLNNLVAALQGNSTSSSSSTSPSSANAARLEREKQSTQHMNQPSTTSTTSTSTTASNKPTSTTSVSGAKYSNALNTLNEYLKTFNPGTYSEVSVKEGKVYFGFKVYSKPYYSSIPISDLTEKTIILQATSVGTPEVKIQCKGEAECFYSSYNEESADHFRFFSHSVKDLSKMEQLLKDFVNALK